MFILDVTNTITGIIFDHIAIDEKSSGCPYQANRFRLEELDDRRSTTLLRTFILPLLATGSSSSLLRSSHPRKLCQLENTLHDFVLRRWFLITNVHAIRWPETSTSWQHFVETVLCFCREIKRLLVLHQDVHRCRPLVHPLGWWCQGCARGVLATRSEIMRSPGRNANQIPIFPFFFYMCDREYKCILLSNAQSIHGWTLSIFLPFTPRVLSSGNIDFHRKLE